MQSLLYIHLSLIFSTNAFLIMISNTVPAEQCLVRKREQTRGVREHAPVKNLKFKNSEMAIEMHLKLPKVMYFFYFYVHLKQRV